MYRRFQIKDIDIVVSEFTKNGQVGVLDEVRRRGRELDEDFASKVKDSVSAISVSADGTIDGDVLEAAWFPQLTFDVFISHSHADRNMALVMSGALKKFFGLDAFVDSVVWNCRDQLIEKMRQLSGNNPYSPCPNPKTENTIVSHADIMLSNSLMRMIDSCECLMFLNTPHSISRKDFSEKTYSAWLYSELVMSKFVRIRKPERYKNCRVLNEGFKSAMDSFSLKISHNADTRHLGVITPEMFIKWIVTAEIKCLRGSPALDSLYEIVGEH